MQFHTTTLAGAHLIRPKPLWDERGYFARTFCTKEFAERGLVSTFVQQSVSFNHRRGTLRGMHWQRPPHGEVKLVACQKGAIWDVIVDLRPGSPTFGRWEGFEITADNRHRLYVPRGFAHGFQTLTDDTEVCYLISDVHVPEASVGHRHDDPAFGIGWPMAPTMMSARDRSWPDFTGVIQPVI